MTNQALSFLLILLLYSTLPMSSILSTHVEGGACKPSDKIKGENPPKYGCNTGTILTAVKMASTTTSTNALPLFQPALSRFNHQGINGFDPGADGGGPSECDNKYHSDDIRIVALSTGWFNKMKRCFKNITIYGNGRSVHAMVVDECDSKMGCDKEHDYQPPCLNNIVDASRAVWEALGVLKKDRGEMKIQWSDA